MKKLVLISFLLLITGCAVGNKYDYRSSSMALPVKAIENRTLILSVEDFRPYVLNGDKKPSFVGLQRGGWGNPFDVTTLTGNAMTEDMSTAIAKGLTDVGYQVIRVQKKSKNDSLVSMAVKEGATRIIELKVYNWKSDIYMGITLHCDLRLYVLDSNGKMLVESTMNFEEEIGGYNIGAGRNSQVMADEFAKRIGYLFNRNEVRDSLR